MSRQGNIDKQSALQMMQQGAKDTEIAARFGTSRQAANLLRKYFVKDGKLDKCESVKQPVKQVPTVSAEGQLSNETTTEAATASAHLSPTFDQIGNWLIQLVKEAGEVRDLRDELVKLKAANASLKNEASRLSEELKKSREALARLEARSNDFNNAVKALAVIPQ